MIAIKISRLFREVTDNAAESTANYGECCSSVAPARLISDPGYHEIATDVPISSRLRDAAAGGKIAHSKI
jgi:hypothetical protein